MPVSVALGLGPAAWVEAAGGASVALEHAALAGFRDREESLAYGMRQPETLNPPPLLRSNDDLRARGPATVAAELPGLLGAPFWLHFDVDVLDEKVFPATDYLMPNGLDWQAATEVLAPLLTSPRLVGASLGCYNPAKDPDLACGRTLVSTLSDAMD